MSVLKRTFEAKRYPKGSPQRWQLNENSQTSEYMPSYRYVGIVNTTHPRLMRCFRTKAEAEAWVAAEKAKVKA